MTRIAHNRPRPEPAAERNAVTITLPIPHEDLFPNGRAYFMAKAKRTAKARRDAGYAAIDAMNRIGWKDAPKWARARTEATFYFRTLRRRDADNCAGACKAYMDGFADAGVVANDSGFTHLPPVLLVDKEHPRVEITVTEAP